MIRILCALTALAIGTLAIAPVSSDFSSQDWKFHRPIQLSLTQPEESFAEVTLNNEVFPYAREDLADLRIIDITIGQEIPYKLLVERGGQFQDSLNVDVRDLGHTPNQITTFVVDMGLKRVLHNELEILTPSENFQRQVLLESSSDQKMWLSLTDTNRIFDFTVQARNINERDTRISYAPSTARYLRISILDDGSFPLEVVGAIAYFNEESLPVEIEVMAIMTTRTENKDGRFTHLVTDLGDRGFFARRLSIRSPQENFYRKVKLDGSDDGKHWINVVNSDSLFVINTPEFSGSKLSLTYPESTYRYYRLTIFNEDNPLLPITTTQTYGFLRKVIFSAKASGTYQLHYGNPNSRAPSYELRHIFPYLAPENLLAGTLGDQIVNAVYLDLSAPVSERYGWLLTAVVGFSSLALGIFLTRLLRQARRLLPPPQ